MAVRELHSASPATIQANRSQGREQRVEARAPRLHWLVISLQLQLPGLEDIAHARKRADQGVSILPQSYVPSHILSGRFQAE